MKLILKFMKPYKKLFALTLILLFVDVIGALYIPTLVADMMNKGAAGTSLNALYTTGFQMAIASILSGIGAIWGGYTCAFLASKVCRDIRNAIYEKSLTLSIYDFKQFGTASITTRTISDITTIQMALISFIQMVLPVPAIFVVALFLTIQLDPMMGSILLVVLAVVILIAAMIMRMASPLFRKLQKLLDRMSTILLENLTSVRVVRAFNKQSSEQERLDHAFQNYANTSIRRQKIAQKLNVLPLRFFDQNQPGEILSRVTNDLDKITETLQTGLFKLLVAIGTIIGSLAVMFYYNIGLTCIFLIFMVISMIITRIVAAQNLKCAADRQTTLGQLMSITEEYYTGKPLRKLTF